MKKAFDAVVLGGGVVGASTAFALAQRGLAVGLIERESQLGAGATSRSSACIRTHYSVEPNSLLANHAVRFFEEFPERLGIVEADPGFEQCGLLLVAQDDTTGQVRRMAAAGVDTELVTAGRAAELHPLVRTDDAAVFGWEPKSGFADPYLTTTWLGRAARARGAELLLGCQATGLELCGGRVAGVHTDRHGLVAAPVVVSCLNIWTGPLLGDWLSEQLPVQPEKHSLISLRALGQPHTRPGPDGAGRLRPLPMVKDLIQPAQPYFRPCAGGAELLVGDNLPEHRRDEDDPDRWDESVALDQMAYCAEIAAGRFPCYAEAEITASWSGLYDCSPDYNPVLGRWPGVPGLSVAFGFSGHGFKLAPTVGQMLADEVVGAPPFDPACSIELYGAGRFHENKPLVGRYEGAAS